MTKASSEPKKEAGGDEKAVGLFKAMASNPFPFLVILPAIFVTLIAVGFTRPNLIQDNVADIWIRKGGDYAKDKDYEVSQGFESSSATAGAFMAIARDGGNLLKESSLDEIVARMQEMERTTVRTLCHCTVVCLNFKLCLDRLQKCYLLVE